MTQPESALSRRFQSHIRAAGGFCFKVHGGPMTMAGVPDIAAVLNGYSIWVETKTPEGKGPSVIQRLRHDEIVASGGHVIVARTATELKEWLELFRRSLAPRNIGTLTTPTSQGYRRPGTR